MADRWPRRTVPPELVDRYEAEGWWTADTLADRFATWLAAHPDAEVHVHSRTHPWSGTYRDIDAEARRLIGLLRAEGIEPGEAVAFQIPNWREAIVSFAALAMGGYVLVPIVHIYGRKELSYILRESGAAAYLSPAAFGHVDYLAAVDAAISSDGLDTLRLHVVVGEEAAPPSVGSLRRIAWSAVDDVDPVAEIARPRADDVAVLAYTSGTTSDPKGVIHEHRTVLSELAHMAGWVNERPNLMGSPVTHATGMLGAVLGPLSRGSAIHVIDRWDPGHALEVMAAHQIGGGTGASVFLATLLDHPDFTPAHAANMGRVGLGGAPVPAALGRRAEALGIKIIRAYGSTEHPSITGSSFDDPPAVRHETDGSPMGGVELRLVDEAGHEVEPGIPGEIWSRGPELCVGYTDPALDERFDDDGWYRTGDVGVQDETGNLTITDRVSDVIIRGGENLSAAEIEGALAAVAGVAEVAVVAAPDERLGEHACAVVRPVDPDAPPTLADLTAHLEAVGLARQKWPEELRIVEDLPRTASGKVRKVDLRAAIRAGADEGA